MIVNCPICGKLTCIHWPEHWVYRRGETYYCSDQCLDVDLVRDMNLIKQVRMERRKKKMYSKTKKDGTPAKKSEPRQKKQEIPEPISGGEWEKMETLDDKSERSDFKAIINPLPVIALKSRVIEIGTYRKNGKMILDIGGTDYLSMTAEGWRELSKEILTALDQLGVTE